MVKIRLARRGSKKRPYYHIVVANSSSPRDGKYIEKIGTFNPFVILESNKCSNINKDRLVFWLKNGAKSSYRVNRLLHLEKINYSS